MSCKPRISFPTRGLSPLKLILAMTFSTLPFAVRAQNSITDMGTLNGGSVSIAYGISSDGAVVVGYAQDGAVSNIFSAGRAFRWTQAGGLVSLGTLNNGSGSEASGVSADGAVVVGHAQDGAASNALRAFRWTHGSGMVSLGTLNGGSESRASGVSADGAVVVGNASDGAANNALRAFRWTQAGGMVSLGAFNGGLDSIASGVSADGAVVVGYADDGSVRNALRAFRWTQAGGIVSLGTLNGGIYSGASGVNADGTVIVGFSSDGAARNASRAFRWTQASGMISLGTLNGGSGSSANGVSADGAVVVGDANDGAANNAQRAFRWSKATGLQSVEAWLRASGVTVPKDITYTAYATSRDGSVVAGWLYSGQAFIARVSSGLITLAEVQESLASTAYGGGIALSTAHTVLNGAHSRPLMRRVAEGQKAFWLAGDWGLDDRGTRNGNLGLAEVGIGHHFGPAQLNIALGQTWATQKQTLSGRAKTDGSYLLLEALVPVSGTLSATFSGYRHWGEADLKRGYINAGMQDLSQGHPDIDTWGLRARLDWEQAFQVAGAGFTPYVDLSYSKTKLAGYIESGGGFPARFDARKEKATELRLGLNAAKPLPGGINLLGTLEAAHRFEERGARTSGQLVGLFNFDLPGQRNRQNWLRAGLGVEGQLAEGKASLSLNVTTKGDAPNAWLAVSWQRAF